MVLTTLLNRPISFGGSKSHMHMVGYKRWTTVGMLDSIVAKVNWIYIYMIWQSGCGQESDGTPQSSVMFFPLQTAWVPKRPRSEVSLCRVQGQSRQKDFESTVFLRRSMIHGSGRRGDRRNAWSADRPREAE